MTKVCSVCGVEKDETEFGWRSAKHKKRVARCRVCNREYERSWRQKHPEIKRASDRRYRQAHPQKCDRRAAQWNKDNPERRRDMVLKSNHGITLKQYEAMLIAQGGVCAICGQPETKKLKGTLCNLAVDHNHSTGKVRALLCHNCNVSLGAMRDNPQRLRKAVAYLEYHR